MPRLLLTNRFLWFSGPSCFYYAAASSASLLAASPLGTTVLALKILQEDLHVHEQSHPILTPVPSAEFVFGAIDRDPRWHEEAEKHLLHRQFRKSRETQQYLGELEGPLKAVLADLGMLKAAQ